MKIGHPMGLGLTDLFLTGLGPTGLTCRFTGHGPTLLCPVGLRIVGPGFF